MNERAERTAQAIYTAKGLYLSPEDSMKAAQAAIDSWKCCGCGKPSPGRFRICDCLTTCVSDDSGKSAWKIDPIPHKLAETIRTKLLGVRPEDQDVVLEDADWQVILAALSLC